MKMKMSDLFLRLIIFILLHNVKHTDRCPLSVLKGLCDDGIVIEIRALKAGSGWVQRLVRQFDDELVIVTLSDCFSVLKLCNFPDDKRI